MKMELQFKPLIKLSEFCIITKHLWCRLDEGYGQLSIIQAHGEYRIRRSENLQKIKYYERTLHFIACLFFHFSHFLFLFLLQLPLTKLGLPISPGDQKFYINIFFMLQIYTPKMLYTCSQLPTGILKMSLG